MGECVMGETNRGLIKEIKDRLSEVPHPFPRYTLLYNIVRDNSPWIGTGWEFYDNKKDGEEAYVRVLRDGHHPTLRPFHKNDIERMGAAHREVLTILWDEIHNDD